MAYPPLEKAALKKLGQMLGHPYAKVRNVVADALVVVGGDEGVGGLRGRVEGLGVRLGVDG